MTRTKSPIDEDFADLVRRDCFGDVTGAEAAHLRSDEMCERWVVELTRVVQSTHMQLENLGRGTGPPRDAQWRHRANHLKNAYARRLNEAKGLVGDFRARMKSGDEYALQGEVDRLRCAIRAHEAAVRAADIEPEEWDTILWSHVMRRKT